MSKICLIGSTRFMDQFNEANVALSLLGHVVYSVATSTKGDFQPTEDQKLALDMVHLTKIDESDAVMLVGRGEDGTIYIGESTRRELMYASLKDKEIFTWNPGRAHEVTGPVREFEEGIRRAAESNAEREQKQREREERSRTAMADLERQLNERLGEHTGESDCPACQRDEEELIEHKPSENQPN